MPDQALTAAHVTVEKARIDEVPQIQRLVNGFAGRGEMLSRPLSEIYENLRDYFVIREGDQVIGCVALHILWEDLAEVKAMAVAEERQREGLGRILIEAAVQEASAMGLSTVFCLTYKPGFFARLGFVEVDMAQLPRKIWGECYRCVKFPQCDEVAMIRTLRPGAAISQLTEAWANHRAHVENGSAST